MSSQGCSLRCLWPCSCGSSPLLSGIKGRKAQKFRAPILMWPGNSWCRRQPAAGHGTTFGEHVLARVSSQDLLMGTNLFETVYKIHGCRRGPGTAPHSNQEAQATPALLFPRSGVKAAMTSCGLWCWDWELSLQGLRPRLLIITVPPTPPSPPPLISILASSKAALAPWPE